MSWDYLPEDRSDPFWAKPLADYQRSQRGAQNRIAGEQFEKIIEAGCFWYKDRGEAEIQKTPEPVKQLGKMDARGRFLACYEKQAQPDFKGTLHGGQSVVFEAKHTDGDRIEYSRVTKEQNERLESHYQLGAVAFVMVSFNLQYFCRIPWSIWRDMKAVYGRKYITFEECGRYRVPYISGVLKLLDGMILK